MPSIIAQRPGKAPFEIFTGTDAECREKLICLKLDQAAGKVVAGLPLKNYTFSVEEAKS